MNEEKVYRCTACRKPIKEKELRSFTDLDLDYLHIPLCPYCGWIHYSGFIEEVDWVSKVIFNE